jgi:glycerol kinase
VAGDQQAATFGQACFAPGMAKNTYGTGCFMLMNTGTCRGAQPAQAAVHRGLGRPGDRRAASHGLLRAGRLGVCMAGATVQWLRDGLQDHPVCARGGSAGQQVPDTGDVYLVPAFAGLGTPHWDGYARGAMVGMTRGTTRAHIARAALESIALQSADVFGAMAQDSGIALRELRVDGGASRNNLLMQMQADFLGCRWCVRKSPRPRRWARPTWLAWRPVSGPARRIDAQWARGPAFEPTLGRCPRRAKLARWRQAVQRAKGAGPTDGAACPMPALPTRREDLIAGWPSRSL